MLNEPPDQPPTEEELRAFIGPRSERYWRRWSWAIQNRRRAGGFWPPFLFNFVWFLYRRMYREVWVPLALLVGVGLAQGMVEGLIEVQRGTPFTTPMMLDRLINICLGLATSWIGSNLYLRKFRKAVIAARQAGANPDATLEILRRSGGTSTLAAGLGVVVAIALFVLGVAANAG